jgi:hypothetical protein
VWPRDRIRRGIQYLHGCSAATSATRGCRAATSAATTSAATVERSHAVGLGEHLRTHSIRIAVHGYLGRTCGGQAAGARFSHRIRRTVLKAMWHRLREVRLSGFPAPGLDVGADEHARVGIFEVGRQGHFQFDDLGFAGEP